MFIVAPTVILLLVAIRTPFFRLDEWRIDKRANCAKKRMLLSIDFGAKVYFRVQWLIVG